MSRRLLVFMILCLAPFFAKADCPKNCDKTCCTKVLGVKTCDLTGACQTACAVFNTSCGHPTLPIPTPILVPGVHTSVPVNLPKNPEVLIAALLTGGMVNPATVKAANVTIRNASKGLSDLSKTVDKAASDTYHEAGRAVRDVGTAAGALAEYSKQIANGDKEIAAHALNRIREGKIIDALWSVGTEDLQNTNKAAAAAAMKSDIIRTLGSVASTAYGGPAGAAAYAAWLTYNQTGGDVNLALKVGIIAGATSWAMDTTQALPAQNASGNIVVSDLAKKVAISGAIGGLAVAAAGGNESAIRKGFLQAGAMVLIQEGYHSYTGHALDNKQLQSSKGDAYCISSVVVCQSPPKDAYVYDKDGNFLGWDQRKLDSFAPHVGMGYPDTSITSDAVTWPTEGSAFMKGVAKIPGTNAMAVFHDQWAVDWRMPSGVLQTTIYPAVILTYNGTTAPLLETVRVASEEEAQRSAKGSSASHPIVYKDATESLPIKADQIETAYTCARGAVNRSITVEVDPGKTKFACRVVYRANLVRTIPWTSITDPRYCDTKGSDLANTQIKAGYSCMVAGATGRLSEANLGSTKSTNP
jgi:hypothetical protein